ncbi:MAG: hypothetical protein KIT87_02820 [Anaerolineae bacterium]|nr:hypothetical protein [Anaerolineae bacterium]
MDHHTDRRLEDVRGEPRDELHFLSHMLIDRLYHKLPPEFWQHTNQARKEIRAALLVLLRAAIEHLTHELEEDEDKKPVSTQRGKIQLDPMDTPPATNGAAAAPPAPTVPPPSIPLDPSSVSRQRKKLTLE